MILFITDAQMHLKDGKKKKKRKNPARSIHCLHSFFSLKRKNSTQVGRSTGVGGGRGAGQRDREMFITSYTHAHYIEKIKNHKRITEGHRRVFEGLSL